MSCFCRHRESQLEPPSPVPDAPASCAPADSCAEDFVLWAFSCPASWLLFQLSGVTTFGNIPDIASRLFALAQSLRAHIVILVLVNLPVHRRPSGMGGVHLPLLRLAQPAQLVRGQFHLAKPQVLGFFGGLFRIGFQLLLSGHRLLHLGFLRGRTGLFCRCFLFDVQLRIVHFCPSETSPNLVVIIR